MYSFPLHVPVTSRKGVVVLGLLTLHSVTAFTQPAAGGARIDEPGSPMELTMEVDFELPKGYELKPTVDLSKWFPPAGNQHRQYSCTAWSIGYGLMSYRFNRALDRTYAPGDILDPKDAFSPAYLFNLMKQFGDQNCETGLSLQDVTRFVMYSGCSKLSEVPYDTAVTACTKPFKNRVIPSAVAKHAPPSTYLNGFDAVQWKYHLSEGRPIVVGISPTCEFMEGGYNRKETGPYIWEWNAKYTTCPGHAVVCTGYADDTTFTFRNSYGQDWGDHGDFRATYKVLEYKCTGGYVMPNDTMPVFPQFPGKPADNDHLVGATVKEKIKAGTFQMINDQRYDMVDIDPRDNRAIIHVHDLNTDTLQQSLVVHFDQPYVFYEDGQSISIVLRPRRGWRQLFSKASVLHVYVIEQEEDPHLQARDDRLKRIREGIRQ
jgi:hypothetical protein